MEPKAAAGTGPRTLPGEGVALIGVYMQFLGIAAGPSELGPVHRPDGLQYSFPGTTLAVTDADTVLDVPRNKNPAPSMIVMSANKTRFDFTTILFRVLSTLAPCAARRNESWPLTHARPVSSSRALELSALLNYAL